MEHLKGNIEALGLRLEDADMQQIEEAYPFDVGFPMNMLGGGPKGPKGPQDIVFSKRLGHFDYVAGPKPIPPHVD